MIKKKVLFVIDSLHLAGAEKSLVTLLNLLDPNKLDIYLQLFSYGGELESMLPEYVNILPKLSYFEACEGGIFETFQKSPKGKKFSFFFSRIRYSLSIRFRKHTNQEEAVLFWKYCGGCFERLLDCYDYAVAYGQNVPTFYVADCVFPLVKRIAWVNANYYVNGFYRRYAFKKYQKIDVISCVSEDAKDSFSNIFPEYNNRLVVTKDIYEGQYIQRMADLPSAAQQEMNRGSWKILTIGRLAPEKGYDIAVKACRILLDRGLDLVWYVLGSGPMEYTLKREIRANSLGDNMILLGTRSNPYPYIKKADIYVQTSKREAFGLAIAEARVLNVPVVSTSFAAINEQIKDRVNGLLCDQNADSVANKIELLFKDKHLYNAIRYSLQTEKKNNSEEIIKINALLGLTGNG